MTANTLNLFGNLLITQEAAQQGGAMGILNMLLPFILIFGIFYFLVILPQRKQMKKHNEMLNQLKKGDVIMMSNGIQGRIAEVKDAELKVEICSNPKVVVTVQKGVVSSVVAKGTEE
ncbi:preprotein translocase subunit YajC [bacterium]|nr:preprotein translocase subunit YajC [bacterium]